MNVLLNASNLRFGGGYTVAYSLIKAIAPLRPQDHFYVIHPAGTRYNGLAGPNITLLPVSRTFHHSFPERLRYNHYIFPKWCKTYSIDKVVSLGNIAFPAKGRPHLLYLQIPHIVYPESVVWQRMDWKSFLRNSIMDQVIALYLRHATTYAVQTPVMRTRFCHRFNLSEERVKIIPNAALPKAFNPENSRQPFKDAKPYKFLFLSKWYAHKNFECLLPLAQLIKERNLPVQISLTIEKSESAGAAMLLESIEQAGLQQIITNLGNIFMSEVGDTILAHDTIFLPSLLESFSGVYAEALAYGRPIFTSNYDFATSLLEQCAFYFDPLKPEHIADVMAHAIDHPDEVEEKQIMAHKLAASMPDWNTIAADFSILLDSFS